MLRISGLKLPIHHSESDLVNAILKRLRISVDRLISHGIYKRSIDARGKQGVRFDYVINVELDARDEAGILGRKKTPAHVVVIGESSYRGLPARAAAAMDPPPVIVGTGPCGLFLGLCLARAGLRPVLLERGKAAGPRARDVTGFWRRGLTFDPESNVQFGEGGAGTFSDGKLYTQIKDRENRIPWILKELAAFGAPEDILFQGRPHIGTDRLIKVVRNIREEIIRLGGEVRFGAKVVDLVVEEGRATGVRLQEGNEVKAGKVIFAIGHSARDTFEMLHRRGVAMEAKGFSVGVRIEHPQALIDSVQFGDSAGDPELGAAAYKTVHHCSRHGRSLTSGRSAYSFCMCPGGLVVASSSEAGGVVTNGMSSYARAESNANSGLMVDVRPEDYASFGSGPLAGIEFQRDLERRAFELGGGDYRAPAQLVGDFLADRPSTGARSVKPSYEPGVVFGNLRDCLPDFIVEVLKEAIPAMNRRLKGFSHPDAVMTAVETRSSSPLRITRDPDSLESLSLPGFIPAGEGAGYAGGIISAAVDGLRVAEVLLAGRQLRDDGSVGFA